MSEGSGEWLSREEWDGVWIDRPKMQQKRPRLASEMPGWVGSEPPPDVLTEDDQWDRWPA